MGQWNTVSPKTIGCSQNVRNGGSEKVSTSDEECNAHCGFINKNSDNNTIEHSSGLCLIAKDLSYSVVYTANLFHRTLNYIKKVFPASSSECLTLPNNFPKTVHILNSVNICIEPGQLLAVMGPSGSGKTTLLNALSGRISETKSKRSERLCFKKRSKSHPEETESKFALKDEEETIESCRLSAGCYLRGGILINGMQCRSSQLRKYSGLVMQKDNLVEHLTVTETLEMAALLKMKDCSRQEVNSVVDRLVHELGLNSVRNNYIGSSSGSTTDGTKSISLGEVKRVAIGIELINNPQILLLDEPTSGLDSSLTFDIFVLLLRITRMYNRTVICSIHQPRSQMFDLFDRLLLMSNGHVVYQGKASEVLDYFDGCGYKCPDRFNPADFIIDIVSVYNVREDSICVDNARKDDRKNTSGVITTHHNHGGRIHVTQEEIDTFPSYYKDSAKSREVNDKIRNYLSAGTLGSIRNKKESVALYSEDSGPSGERTLLAAGNTKSKKDTLSKNGCSKKADRGFDLADISVASCYSPSPSSLSSRSNFSNKVGSLSLSNSTFDISEIAAPAASSKKSGFLRTLLHGFIEIKLVYWRTFSYWIRNPKSGLAGTILIHIILSVALGGIWFQLRGSEGKTTSMFGLILHGFDNAQNEIMMLASDFRNIIGALFFVVVFLSFSSFSGVASYSSERVIFNRETAAQMYQPISYFIGKTLADMPYQHIPATIFVIIFYFMAGLDPLPGKVVFFIAACNLTVFAGNSFAYFLVGTFRSVNIVYLLAPISLVMMMLLASFFISLADLPPWIYWCQHTSFIKYAFSILAVNQLPPDDKFGVVTNGLLLKAMGLPSAHQELFYNTLGLIIWGVFFRILAFVALTYCNRRQGLEA